MDFLDLLECALFVEAVRDGHRLRMVRQRDVVVPQRLRGLAHLLDRILSIRRGRVHLQVAANVVER